MFATTVESNRLVRHSAVGPITSVSVADAFLRWFDSPDFEPATPVLWDCRDQRIDTTLPELAHLYRRTIGRTPQRRARGSRSAILVSGALSAAALGVIPQSDRYVAEFRIFQNEAAALAWLGVTDERSGPGPGG